MTGIYPWMLLVEGNNDVHVCLNLLGIRHLITPSNPPDDDRKISSVTFNGNKFGIKNKDGINNLLNTLDVEVDASGLQILGFIVDADSNLNKRWQEITAALNLAGYTAVPADPDPNGTIIHQPGKPKIGVWIMPDNQQTGMLEDFLSNLVPNKASDLLWNHAATSVTQAITISSTITNFSKAHLYTWLAWKKDPGTPLGLAITKHYLDGNVQEAQDLINWLQLLFS